MPSLLLDAFIYLCAAVVAVPIAKRLGLGSVLGYLIAGILIGPVTGLVGSETEEIKHFAEFGVVMMLFLIGLELEPHKLWELRSRLIGLGGLQVLATVAAISSVALLLGQEWRTALLCGLIFALSSTAIVLQTLTEKGLARTDGGEASFSILLMQDISVIPMLALIPLLASPGAGDVDAVMHAADTHTMSLVHGLSGWSYAFVVLSAVALVVLAGHYLSRPLFRFIAESHLREIFTASALLLVVGIALLMSLVDLSPALGTFLAGVVLADSEFRRELESDIEPFKGLLLGLFFITVGAGIDFALLGQHIALVLGLTFGVIAIKGVVLYALARVFGLPAGDRWLLTLGMAQAGEFGFVLLSFSTQHQVMGADLASLLSLIVALSMLMTPALFILYDRLIVARLRGEPAREADTIDTEGTVIIAGIGRFGQIVNRILVASGVRTVVLDHSAAQIERQRRFGITSFYGDATRPDLLRAAGIDRAKVFVVAIDDRDRAVDVVSWVHRHHPHVCIIARAFDVPHLYLLKQAGADLAVRELFDSSLTAGAEALKSLGRHPYRVERMMRAFTAHDRRSIEQLYEAWDENPDLSSNRAFLAAVRALSEDLEESLKTDRLQLHDRTERGWTPPPRDYGDELER